LNHSSVKVLFLGNSQMYVCDVPRMIEVMAESAPPGRPRIEATKSLVSGASLRLHWDNRGTRIETGGYDHVVIQEIYNNGDPEFSLYADRFHDLITRCGAKTILFATASVTEFYSPDCSFPASTVRLNAMQIAFGRARGVRVAAAGYAWIRYLGPSPSKEQIWDLYATDRGHPGAKGSYIYACLLYACLTGHDPTGLTGEFKDIGGGIAIDKDEARMMQKAAWEQYLADGQ